MWHVSVLHNVVRNAGEWNKTTVRLAGWLSFGRPPCRGVCRRDAARQTDNTCLLDLTLELWSSATYYLAPKFGSGVFKEADFVPKSCCERQ